MLAFLTRLRFAGGSVSTGVQYEPSQLRWSGPQAGGDWLEGPECFVVEVDGKFIVNSDRQLCVTSAGKYQGYAFTPGKLLELARQDRCGLRVVYDRTAEYEDRGREAWKHQYTCQFRQMAMQLWHWWDLEVCAHGYRVCPECHPCTCAEPRKEKGIT